MKLHYLVFADGRKVRVEWNMNSMHEFTAITGKELTDLAGMKADIATLRTIALCCIREGEDIEGRSFDLSEKELGRLMGMQEIIKFSEILTELSSGAQKKSEPPNRFPKIFRRGKG
jgi:hypothetical protein